MAKTQYLNYTVYLTDATVVAAQQAAYGAGGALMSPELAAANFNAPIQLEGTPLVAPCTRSPWFQSNNNYPRGNTYFTRKSGGWFGISFLFGTTTKFWWSGHFALAADAAAPTVDESDDTTALPAANLSQRRFINGFEGPGINGSGVDASMGSIATNSCITRGASRLPGGYGLALRGDKGRYSITVMSQIGGGASTFRESWERFYMRRRSDGAGFVWSAIDNGSRGIFMQMLSGGNAILHDGTSGTPNPVAAFALAPTKNRWYKVDIFIRWGAFGDPNEPLGRVAVYVDGVQMTNVQPTGVGGINAAAAPKHTQTDFGFGGTNENNFAVDIDDHINADPPMPDYHVGRNYTVGQQVFYTNKFYRCLVNNGPASSLEAPGSGVKWERVAPPLDFANGSSIRAVLPQTLAAANTFAGDVRVLMQKPVSGASAFAQGMTSAVSGAICQAVTDWATRIAAMPGSLNVIPAFLASAYANRGSVVNGFVGYKINAAAAVMSAALTQTTSVAWISLLYRPAAAVPAPASITALELIQQKGAEAISSRCDALLAQVEVLGNWGACDKPYGTTDEIYTEFDFYAVEHNPHIPFSQWTRSDNAPISPVMVKSGTYVGNGTGQDIALKAPPHFVFIRAAVADAGGVRWWPSMAGPHLSNAEATSGICIPDVREDPNFPDAVAEDAQEQQYFIRIAGTGTQHNALGVTYQYVVICDPGMRFLCAGSGSQDTGLALAPIEVAVKLANQNFVPIAALGVAENVGQATVGAALFFRGAGHTTTQAARAEAAVTTNGMQLTTGGINLYGTGGVITQDGDTMAALAIRSDDGSTDPGKVRVVQVATWTGNGSGSRDILIPGATGRRPLFVMVFPNDAGGMHYRDPMHTGTTSSKFDGVANAATAITAGAIDQFTVGSVLNVNTVVYHAFIVVGDTVAGNGGWSANAELFPVEPDSPTDWPGVADPVPADQGFDENGNPLPPSTGGGAILSTDADLDTATAILTTAANVGGLVGGSPCETYVRELVNIALSHLEISKVVGNLATELSEAAALARRHVKADINTVLRAFPWDFATRYANLVLVAGTEAAPVNNDWIYSYRAPTAMITARRIAKVSKGRTFDPTPIAFRLAQDASGLLVYCNELASASVPLVLEYTYRNECPAFWGDPLFREALTWKFAASLSPLARDGKKKEFCLQMFRDTVGRGQTVDANEQQQEPNGDAEWISGRN